MKELPTINKISLTDGESQKVSYQNRISVSQKGLGPIETRPTQISQQQEKKEKLQFKTLEQSMTKTKTTPKTQTRIQILLEQQNPLSGSDTSNDSADFSEFGESKMLKAQTKLDTQDNDDLKPLEISQITPPMGTNQRTTPTPYESYQQVLTKPAPMKRFQDNSEHTTELIMSTFREPTNTNSMTENDFYTNNEDLERNQTPPQTQKNRPKEDHEQVHFDFKNQMDQVPEHVNQPYIRKLSTAMDRTNSKLELARETQHSNSDDGDFDRADPVINIQVESRPGQEQLLGLGQGSKANQKHPNSNLNLNKDFGQNKQFFDSKDSLANSNPKDLKDLKDGKKQSLVYRGSSKNPLQTDSFVDPTQTANLLKQSLRQAELKTKKPDQPKSRNNNSTLQPQNTGRQGAQTTGFNVIKSPPSRQAPASTQTGSKYQLNKPNSRLAQTSKQLNPASRQQNQERVTMKSRGQFQKKKPINFIQKNIQESKAKARKKILGSLTRSNHAGNMNIPVDGPDFEKARSRNRLGVIEFNADNSDFIKARSMSGRRRSSNANGSDSNKSIRSGSQVGMVVQKKHEFNFNIYKQVSNNLPKPGIFISGSGTGRGPLPREIKRTIKKEGDGIQIIPLDRDFQYGSEDGSRSGRSGNGSPRGLGRSGIQFGSNSRAENGSPQRSGKATNQAVKDQFQGKLEQIVGNPNTNGRNKAGNLEMMQSQNSNSAFYPLGTPSSLNFSLQRRQSDLVNTGLKTTRGLKPDQISQNRQRSRSKDIGSVGFFQNKKTPTSSRKEGLNQVGLTNQNASKPVQTLKTPQAKTPVIDKRKGSHGSSQRRPSGIDIRKGSRNQHHTPTKVINIKLDVLSNKMPPSSHSPVPVKTVKKKMGSRCRSLDLTPENSEKNGSTSHMNLQIRVPGHETKNAILDRKSESVSDDMGDIDEFIPSNFKNNNPINPSKQPDEERPTRQNKESQNDHSIAIRKNKKQNEKSVNAPNNQNRKNNDSHNERPTNQNRQGNDSHNERLTNQNRQGNDSHNERPTNQNRQGNDSHNERPTNQNKKVNGENNDPQQKQNNLPKQQNLTLKKDNTLPEEKIQKTTADETSKHHENNNQPTRSYITSQNDFTTNKPIQKDTSKKLKIAQPDDLKRDRHFKPVQSKEKPGRTDRPFFEPTSDIHQSQMIKDSDKELLAIYEAFVRPKQFADLLPLTGQGLFGPQIDQIDSIGKPEVSKQLKSVQTFNLADYPRLQQLVEDRSNQELEQALDQADANNLRNSYGGFSADSDNFIRGEITFKNRDSRISKHGGSMRNNDTFGARQSTLRDTPVDQEDHREPQFQAEQFMQTFPDSQAKESSNRIQSEVRPLRNNRNWYQYEGSNSKGLQIQTDPNLELA